MTNQKFRDDNWEKIERLIFPRLDFIQKTLLAQIIDTYDYTLTDCENKLKEAQKNIETLLAKQLINDSGNDAIESLAYNSCKQCLDIQTERLNEAIEVMKFYADESNSESTNGTIGNGLDCKPQKIVWEINGLKANTKAKEFLNKISSSEE